MTTSAFQTSIRLFLAGTMLLVGLVPPGYRHAHPGGGVAHQHAGHGHFHMGHHPRQRTDHPHSDDVPLSAGRVAHVHLAFLFFEVTLPGSDRSGADPDTDLAGDVLYVVRLTDECVPTTRTAPTTPIVEVSASWGAPAAVTNLLGKSGSGPRGDAVLLCDTARHKRSGVQLF